jgi:hypothetical protein
MCFQRDSRKDMIIVWGFILGTAGLLGWAAVKRVVEARDLKRKGVAGGLGVGDLGSSGQGSGRGQQGRGAYAPVGEEDGVR